MDWLLKFFGGTGGSIVKDVGDVVDKFVTTDAERLEATRKLQELFQQFQVKLIEEHTAHEAQQAEVIKAEVQGSVLARNWRPILMLVFTYVILHNFVVAPLFSLHPVEVPPDMWELLKLGMGGYIMGRTAEKIVPGVVEAITAKKAEK